MTIVLTWAKKILWGFSANILCIMMELRGNWIKGLLKWWYKGHLFWWNISQYQDWNCNSCKCEQGTHTNLDKQGIIPLLYLLFKVHVSIVKRWSSHKHPCSIISIQQRTHHSCQLWNIHKECQGCSKNAS